MQLTLQQCWRAAIPSEGTYCSSFATFQCFKQRQANSTIFSLRLSQYIKTVTSFCLATFSSGDGDWTDSSRRDCGEPICSPSQHQQKSTEYPEDCENMDTVLLLSHLNCSYPVLFWRMSSQKQFKAKLHCKNDPEHVFPSHVLQRCWADLITFLLPSPVPSQYLQNHFASDP